MIRPSHLTVNPRTITPINAVIAPTMAAICAARSRWPTLTILR
jgi:hypothetical protein